MIWYCFIWE